MLHNLSKGILATIGLSLIACSNRQASLQETKEIQPLVFKEVKNPAGPGSAYGNLAAKNKRIYLSWLDASRETSVLTSELSSGIWQPVDTLAAGKQVIQNFADFPSVAVLPNDSLAIHYLKANSDELFAYDVQLHIGNVGQWSEPLQPHKDNTTTEHGFVSMFTVENSLGVAWLDGRNFAGAEDAHAHGAGPMTLRFAQLSKDELSPSQVLDARVCDCCQTDAATTPHGALLVYRDRSEDEIRDIGLLRYQNGSWSEPRLLWKDNWQIHGCPVNGPAIAAHETQAAIAWFTAPEGKAQVKLSLSADEGSSWSDPLVIDSTGVLGRVDIVMLPDNMLAVSWIDGENEPATLKVARFSFTGEKISEQVVAEVAGNRTAGFPRMAVTDSALWITYTNLPEGEAKQLKLVKAVL